MLVLMSVLAGMVGSASAVLFGPEVWAVCVMWKERRRRPNKEELASLSERQFLYTKQVQLTPCRGFSFC